MRVDLTLSTQLQEVTGELPQHRRPSPFTNVGGLIQLCKEAFIEHDLYGFHVDILCGVVQWSKSCPRDWARAHGVQPLTEGGVLEGLRFGGTQESPLVAGEVDEEGGTCSCWPSEGAYG